MIRRKYFLRLGLVFGFSIFIFLSSPTKARANLYTADPVGLTSIFVENPYNCKMRYFWENQDSVIFWEGESGGTPSGTDRSLVRYLSAIAVLRGEWINFGYEPRSSQPEGKICPPAGVVSMNNTTATIEELPPFPTDFMIISPDNSKLKYHKITFPGGFIFHLYIFPYPEQPAYIVREIFHPVIFIHGLGGKPEDWLTGNKQDYRLKFLEAGYPDEFLVGYAYADSDGDPNTYDYQGDVTKLEDNMPAMVNDLANKFEQIYGRPCNNSCVDLAGFSLGGIIAREYLNEHPLDNKIRKVVAIGSPHLGSFWLEPYNWTDSLPFGGYLKTAIVEFYGSILISWGLVNQSDQILDIHSPALQQLVPDSNFLQQFNNYFYSNNQFFTIAGDIDAQITQSIFHFKLMSPSFSLGDLLVSKDSGLAIPASFNATRIYSDSEKTVLGDISLTKNLDDTWKYSVDFLNPGELKYWHLSLPKQEEVIEYVLNSLIKDE